MKIIIAGGRDFNNYYYAKEFLDQYIKITDELEIVCGEAKGADQMGKQWAKENNILIKSFPADWNKYGKGAGYIRNSIMADYADSLVAFWDGKSKGTADMINKMKKLNKPVIICKYAKEL